VTTGLTIGADEIVSSSTASGIDPEVESCAAHVIEGIELPKRKSGERVVIVVDGTTRVGRRPRHPRSDSQSRPVSGTGRFAKNCKRD